MYRTQISAVVFISAMSLAATALGDTFLVPGDYSTIQAAIDACDMAGDEIVVGPGTYPEAINFLGKAIYLHGSDGSEVTTIDATAVGGSVVTCSSGEGPDTILEGFTITGGTGTDPGNGVFRGGGMYNDASSPTVINCTFNGNQAKSGAGMANFNASSPTVTNCTFSENGAQAFGTGGGMANVNGSNPTVTNCRFSENWAHGHGGGMANFSNSSPTVTNSILWGNVPDQSSGAPMEVNYSIVQGGWGGAGGTGVLDADALFVDADNDDFRLSPDSPCIDAGDNTGLPEGTTTDLDGNPRFVDDPTTPDTGNPDGVHPIVDMGAYEFQPADFCIDDDGDGKVTICHVPPGNPSNAHTISVNVNAVEAHIGHGDECGPCQ